MSRQLIVNADDFARSPEVSRGILAAHQQGIVTTTTVLINLPGAVQAVQKAARSAPELGMGLHLNLTLGTPCSPKSDIRELFGEDNLFHKVDYWHENLQSIPIKMVEIEWRAQIATFISTGLKVDHLDSHHHIAVIRPDIWGLYLELAMELNCGVRPPYPDDVSCDDLQKLFPAHFLENARTKAFPALKQSSVPHPDSFLGSFFDEQANLDHLLELLEGISTGTTELMCHPGYTSETLEATSSYARRRVVELEALVDQCTKQKIEDLEIDLVTYQQVWPSLTPILQKFLKVFFHNLYTRFAFLYDAVAWLSSMGQWHKWVKTAQVKFEPGLILELGHGPGHLMHEMKQAEISIIGLDPSPSMNRMAYHRLQSAGYAADIVRGIAQALSFADGSFSAIISTFPSEYIFDPDTLSEVHRVLAMEGTLIIVGFVEITGTSIPDRFARWLYTITGQSGPTPHGWEEFLLEHGFEPRLERVFLDRSHVTRLVATRR